jgi:hypothetical protein
MKFCKCHIGLEAVPKVRADADHEVEPPDADGRFA